MCILIALFRFTIKWLDIHPENHSKRQYFVRNNVVTFKRKEVIKIIIWKQLAKYVAVIILKIKLNFAVSY